MIKSPEVRLTLPASRRTNNELYTLIEHVVLPKLEENATELKEIRANLIRAGLDNGHAADIKQFFDRRAKLQAGLEWLGELFQPVARFKVTAAVIGALSALAWGILGFQNLIASIHPSHP